MNLSNQQKKILKKIEFNSVNLKDLYPFYSYTSNLFAGLKSLEKRGFIKKEKDIISITPKGKSYIKYYLI